MSRKHFSWALLVALAWLRPAEAGFNRGDATGDGVVSLPDSIMIFGCLFLGSACPACSDAGDFDDDGKMTIADGIGGLSFLFLGTAGPPPPPSVATGTVCGEDLTPDGLDCAFYPVCP